MPPAMFSELQTITCFGFITLQVPARWTCERNADGMWVCSEETGDDPDRDTGTLWVNFDAWLPPEPSGVGRAAVVELARGAAESVAAEPATSVAEVVERPAGALVRSVSEAEENGLNLRFQRWDHFMALGRHMVFVNLSLVLVACLADRPEFVELAATARRPMPASACRSSRPGWRRGTRPPCGRERGPCACTREDSPYICRRTGRLVPVVSLGLFCRGLGGAFQKAATGPADPRGE